MSLGHISFIADFKTVGEADKHTRALWRFGRDVPVLAAAAPASTSAREGSSLMSRGLWRGAAVGGESWNEHARNREQGASQSASRRCQASCPCAVTKLAWSKQRPGAAKPCLRARPCSVTSRRGDGSYRGRPDLTLPSWQVSDQKLGRQVWPPSRRPLGLISCGLGCLRRVFM